VSLIEPITVSSHVVAITIHDLHVSYATKQGKIAALHRFSLSIEPGSFVAVVGPSGCGKTTLLRTLGGLVAPDMGHITIGGYAPPDARDRRMISLLFQRAVLLPWKTALDNVALPLRLFGWPSSRCKERAFELLTLVGLQDAATRYPHQLSGGMQQRVALARALSFEPSVLLMDEPFSSLDEITRERMHLELMHIWANTRATTLFVTHSLAEAVLLADRVVVMSNQPGTLLDDVPIPFSRPRTAEIFVHDDFLRTVAELRRLLAKGYRSHTTHTSRTPA
jgi:NitT/TauT family transport system ATP-binding protein